MAREVRVVMHRPHPGYRVSFYASQELHDALMRTAQMEQRSTGAVVASIVEAVLTDGGEIALEDVAVVDGE